MPAPTSYPAGWETDVVLADGSTAHVRPITPDDADRLVAFYARVSDESKYFRFFAPYPVLQPRDVERFTRVDHVTRGALIVLVGDDMVAVGRYEHVVDSVAEVSFLVEDSQQGRGLGSLLLEQLAQAARERGFTKFVADVLPSNRKMIGVFRDAGYRVHNRFEDGVVHLEFGIDPTETSIEVMAARERKSEARSVERLLTPRAVAVVGASRQRDTVGQTLVRNLVLGGFTGPVYAVNPNAAAIAGVPAYPSLRDLPGEVDLAVVAVPADAVPAVVADAAAKGVRGLVVVSAGFAETGEEGRRRQSALVHLARANGMRVVGPNCLGVVNTDPAVSLNASLSSVLPPPGRIGLFSQSGALGTAILEQVAARGLGLSSFVSAGNRADVSGNDVLQFWDSDPRTEVLLLYLESIGNPRKFSRIARRIARTKPIVAVKSGRRTQGRPLGHAVRETDAPAAAVDALFRQAGVVGVDTLPELLDVAQLLAAQPLPAGPRVAIVGNSDALTLLTADAAVTAGLDLVGDPVDLGAEASAEDYRAALADRLADDAVQAVVVVFVTAVVQRGSAESVAEVLASAATTPNGTGKPVVATFLGVRGVPPLLAPVPSYPSPEEAVRALARVAAYAQWRARPAGTVPDLPDCDEETARRLVESLLEGEHPEGGTAESGVDLTPEQLEALLACYGIRLLPARPVPTIRAALETAAALGWDGGLVLKATAPHVRQRPDLAGVWRSIDSTGELRTAWRSITDALGDPVEAGLVLQPMAAAGVPVVVRAREDPLFGPMLSFGIAGLSTELLADRSYRIPPLTDVDAAAMVREVRAAPMLFGYRGADPADVAAVEDLLHRVARLTDDLPELARLDLDPVLVAPRGLAVVGATGRLAAPPSRSDWYARRLG